MQPSSVPIRIRALNRVLPQGVLRWRLSSAQALEDAARKSLDCSAELTTHSREALEVLLQSYRSTARLHPLGEIMTAVNILSLIKHQLSLNENWERAENAGLRDVKAPLIITGLPRTGSTLLFNLLANDPLWRMPLSWESTRPAPIPTSSFAKRFRIAHTQARFQMIELLHPGFRAIHELDAELPQECIVITAPALRSHMFFTSAFVPHYQDWLDAQPQAETYTHHQRFLKYLQQTQQPNWLLKAPSHLFSIDGLLATYPDARLVHTQRQPDKVVGSIASLQWHLYRTFSDFSDLNELGQQVCQRWGNAHKSFVNKLKSSADLRQRTFSLDYGQLIDNPLKQVEALYAFFDQPLSAAVVERMQQYLRQRPQHHFGNHRYTLADYGLTTASVNHAFGI